MIKLLFALFICLVNLYANPFGEYSSKYSDISIKGDLSYEYFTVNSRHNICELRGKLKRDANLFIYEDNDCQLTIKENTNGSIWLEAQNCNDGCGLGVHIRNETLSKK